MHRHNSEIQIALVSKRRTLLTWKVVNRYKISTVPLMLNEDKNIDGSLVLDLRI